MNQKNIIIILIAIIVVLAAMIGIAILHSSDGREASMVKITSNKTIHERNSISIKLTDLNKTPICREIVNITVYNGKGQLVVDNVVKTDSKGKAKLDLDLKKGDYTVNVTYGGNENYTANSTSQKLTVKEKVAEAKTTSSSTASNTHVVIGEDGYYALVDDSGNILKNLGPSKKYYPNNPNARNYPNAESMGKYIDKSLG